MDELLNTLPCGVASFTDDGVVRSANATLAIMLGYAVEEIEGQHLERLLTVSGRIFYQTHLFPLLRLHGRATEIFLLLRRKDGSDVGALMNAIRHERGGIVVNDCAMIEVSERRKYEDELLRARRAADATSAELRERTREMERANEMLEQQAYALASQHEQLQQQTEELELQGEELQTTNDELMARSEELEHARAVAEEANKAKSQFLATMSHELRTPLNAIGGYLQLMEMGIYGSVTHEQRDAIDKISRSQRHLLRLINDVLNLARIEAGRVDYAVEKVPLTGVMANVLPLLEPQLAQAGLTFDADVPSGLVAAADRDKVEQILINLLTNAVKFTPPGGSVRMDATRDRAEGTVMMRVIDTGIGIPASKRDAVFDPFVQVPAEGMDRKEGTGLGLAISRDLARGMGGDLSLLPAESEGSTFLLTLRSAAD